VIQLKKFHGQIVVIHGVAAFRVKIEDRLWGIWDWFRASLFMMMF
jgi:hypothetical protein